MEVNKKEISVDEALKFSSFETLLLQRRENNMLLSDYQIFVLNNNGINYSNFSTYKELLFEIENCLDDDYDEELDVVASQIAEHIYYNETKK